MDALKELINKYGQELVNDQLEIESRYKLLAEDRTMASFERSKKAGQASDVSIGKRYMDYKLDDVIANMEVFVTTSIAPKKGVKPKYYAILQTLSSIYQEDAARLYKMLSVTTFSALLNATFSNHSMLSNISAEVAKYVEDEAQMEAFLQAYPDIEESVSRGVSERIQHHYKVFYAKQRMKHAEFYWNNWDQDDSKVLGAKLIEMVMDATGYFYQHQEASANGDQVLEIRPCQELVDAWSKSEQAMASKAFRLVPMVIPPKAWSSFRDGGYWGALSDSSTLLRIHDLGNNVFSKQYLERIDQLELTNVKSAVNALQATPWTINKRVLEIAQKIVKMGGDRAGLPLMDKLPEIPKLVGEFTPEQLKDHKKKLADRYRLDGRRLSKAYRVSSHIAIAKEFSKYEKIYFPCNMDFRGRIYPISSFSFQGDDLNKALILFADAPACQSNADMEWLMIHGANLAGIDKVSFADRIKWIKDHEQYILQVAEDPMSHISWWGNDKEIDSPMQFLAFCFEYARAKAHIENHGTLKGFKTGIVIAFDGTCSGLQHFSAIFRDPIGGKAVNLLPADKPQDIYAEVAKKVNEQLKKDAMNGTADEIRENDKGTYTKLGTKFLAQEWLNFGVNRKVCKRSVMTLAYGSREYGFKEQIIEDTITPALLEAGDTVIWQSPNQSAQYLAHLIWVAVGQTVVKAVEGMRWLQDLAKKVCKQGHTVTWETPMGLPVQQSYMECKTDVIRLRFAGEFKRLYTYKMTGDIHKAHQTSGIAPNFIHSMDASHLQLTILNCLAKGINHFAMIHDSYGCPLSQAGEMFRTVRESFIEMYTKHDVLAKFEEDMKVYLDKNDTLPTVPAKGNLDLKDVLNSLYTFH